MADSVVPFREAIEPPSAEKEGPILVVTAAVRRLSEGGLTDRLQGGRRGLPPPGEGSDGANRDGLDRCWGAQAMRHLRATYLNDQWDGFIEDRIEREQTRLYGKNAAYRSAGYTLSKRARRCIAFPFPKLSWHTLSSALQHQESRRGHGKPPRVRIETLS